MPPFTLASRAKQTFQALVRNSATQDEPFVDVLPPGSHPDTRSVRAANTCRIAVHRPQGGNVLVVLVGHRQPRQGGCGPGRAEFEHHVWPTGNGRSGTAGGVSVTLTAAPGGLPELPSNAPVTSRGLAFLNQTLEDIVMNVATEMPLTVRLHQ
jgi:hypothetical protein